MFQAQFISFMDRLLCADEFTIFCCWVPDLPLEIEVTRTQKTSEGLATLWRHQGVDVQGTGAKSQNAARDFSDIADTKHQLRVGALCHAVTI